MLEDKDLPPSQSSESKKPKPGKRNRKKKSASTGLGGDGQAPTTSSATNVTVTSTDVISERLATLSVGPDAAVGPIPIPLVGLNTGSEVSVKPIPIPGPKKRSPKKVKPKSDNNPVKVADDGENKNKKPRDKQQRQPNIEPKAQQPLNLSTGGAIGEVSSEVSLAKGEEKKAQSSGASPKDGLNRNVQNSENPGKKRNKNKNAFRKPAQVIQLGSNQASSCSSPSVSSIEDITKGPEEKFTGVKPKVYGAASTNSAVSPKKSPSKNRESGRVATSIEEAFDNEDIEDAEEAAKPKRATKASAEAAFADLEKYTGIKLDQTDKTALCLRPKFASGTVGKKTIVLTNFFRLKIQSNVVYQYDVLFLKSDENSSKKKEEKEEEIGRKFKRLTKRMNQNLLRRFVETTGSELFNCVSYAYDNDRILITNKPLDLISKEGSIYNFQFLDEENGEPQNQTIHIRIKHTTTFRLDLDLDNSTSENIGKNRAVLQILDIIGKAHAFRNDIIYGSKIFLSSSLRDRIPMEVESYVRGNKTCFKTPYELAFGYHQSTQLCQAGPMQNIDRATAVLYKGGQLIDTIRDLFGDRLPNFFGAREMETLKELTFLRIETHYRGFRSRHTLRSFSKKPCNETFFKDEDGSQKSVADYFRQHYHLDLKYPHLPCVEYNPGRFIPIEMCSLLADQRNQRKLRDELIRIVSKHTTQQTPHNRSLDTVSAAETIAGQLTNNGFNIELIPQAVKANSRVLSSPLLTYGNKTRYSPEDPGSWDMRKKTFLNPIALSRWTCISLDSRKIDERVAGAFVEALIGQGSALGIQISEPSVPIKRIGTERLEQTFKSFASCNLQLIVVMMPEDTKLYSLVKSIGDQKLGVPTQVVLDKHYNPRGQRQKLLDNAYLSNLLLKINMKIGGTNLKLCDNACSVLNDKTMVVGVDVNHPSPGENSPSIAAVVGSIDKDFAQYRTEIQLNNSRDEIVQVDRMIEPILKAFKDNRGYYPGHIIVYRDGVSEGQFAAVMGTEILPLHKKLEQLPTKPELTYIIVQKRHNTRFFPTEKHMATRSGNILPGSVIDTDICHYKWFDFYLCSQNSFLGTARPGKYTVLWHSSSANANDLQMATYYLCYLFARATKSIADPAPARYAHHAAARGKVHLKQILLNRGQRGQNRDVNQELNRAVNVTTNLQQILYFI